MSKLWLSRLACVLGLVVLALPAVNCYQSGGHLRCGLSSGGGKAASPVNRYLFIAGKRKNTGSTIRPDRRLWPPFRWEATLGLFDRAHTNLETSSFGISVLADGFSGFAGATLHRSGDGVDIIPQIQGDGVEPTTLHVAGALSAEVAIVHDGIFLVVLARAPGDVAYQELERRAAPIDAYQPSIDADTLPIGVRVCFDDLRVVNVGRKPGLDALGTLREDAYLAADAVLEAGRLADGPEPDGPATVVQLTSARDRIDAVIGSAAGAGASSKAKTKLKSARMKLASAITSIQGTRSPATYYKPVSAAAKAVLRSAAALK